MPAQLPSEYPRLRVFNVGAEFDMNTPPAPNCIVRCIRHRQLHYILFLNGRLVRGESYPLTRR